MKAYVGFLFVDILGINVLFVNKHSVVSEQWKGMSSSTVEDKTTPKVPTIGCSQGQSFLKTNTELRWVCNYIIFKAFSFL